MLKKTVIDHYKRQASVAKVLRVARSTVHGWGDIIPEKQALKLDKITDGKLKYDASLYDQANQQA